MTIHSCTRRAKACVNCPWPDQPKVPDYGEVDHPKIALIAEAPGETEQAKGRPLIGRSGQLIRRILADLKVDPDEVFYGNVCLCKPPAGQKPTPTSTMIDACYTGLMDELDRVKPKVIIALGSISAKVLGQYSRGVGKSRGHYRELALSDGTRVGVMPTYHPAAILRNPDLFRDLIQDMDRAVNIANGQPPFIAPPYENYLVVDDQLTLAAVLDEIQRDAKVIALDLETTNRDIFKGRILDIGLGWKREHAAAIDWQLFKEPKFRGRLKEILRTIPVSMQKSSFDLPWLMVRGFDVNLRFDTEIAHWLTDERPGIHSLDQMATQYYDAPDYKLRLRRKYGMGDYIDDETEFADLFAQIPDHERRIYNATDVDYTYRLTVDLKDELKDQGMLPLMNLLITATKLYAELYVTGIDVDLEYLDTLEAELKQKAAKLKRKLDKLNPNVNPASPKQLAKYLFDDLKLPSFGGFTSEEKGRVPEDFITRGMTSVDDPEAQEYWRTARLTLYEGAGTSAEGRGLSARSTGAVMLYWLAQFHEYPKTLIHYKRTQKLIATYIGGIRKNLWPDGKIRPDYKLDGTVVGRFKTSRPALHNLPFGSPVYNAYVAPKGWKILHADYRQVDLRVMACFSGDENLVEWLKGDPHDEALKVMMAKNMTPEEVDKMKVEDHDKYSRLRVAAKMINFGIPYGRSATNLAPQLGVTVAEAKTFINDYWRRLPDLHRWALRQGPDLIRHGQEHVSIFGNKRRFPLVLDNKHRLEIARLAVHFPVMSSVNYISCLAHIETVKALRAEGIDTRVYPHIHDSINVAVPNADVERAARIVAQVMASIPPSKGLDLLPFPVEVTAGYRWGDQKKVYEGDGSEKARK